MQQDQIWLALWAECKDRFTVVLDTLRQRGISADTKMEFNPPVSIPRPFIQIQMSMNTDKEKAIWKEIVEFCLYGYKVHVIDLRDP